MEESHEFEGQMGSLGNIERKGTSQAEVTTLIGNGVDTISGYYVY